MAPKRPKKNGKFPEQLLVVPEVVGELSPRSRGEIEQL